MQRAFLFLAVAFFLHAQESARTVGIFMKFDSIPGAAPLRIMEEKVQELLKPSGLSLDWRMIGSNKGSEPFSGLVVLSFKGACRIEVSTPAPRDFGTIGESRALAVTKVRDSRVLPFGEVRCDEVRAALSYLPPGAGSAERQTALGIALGRVVAHELYHVLAHTTAHAAQGLARASQSLKDLVSTREVGFRQEDWAAIREGLETQER